MSALRATGLLDTGAEAAFDRLARLVCRAIAAPVALVSVVDADRQFFKGASGLAEPWATRRRTPLSHSFCRHVVATGRPFAVEDAREHPLVCDNRAVTELGVVAYLGVPLALPGGHVIGAVCAIDGAPRAWTADDAAALRDLADTALGEVTLRRLNRDLEGRVREEVAAREAAHARSTRALRLEALERLAGGVAHDVNNALQAVRSGVEAARRRLARDPDAADASLGHAAEACRRCARVAARLLAFAREDELRPEPLDAAELLAALVREIAPALGGGVVLRSTVEPDLPGLRADRARLRAVLAGLVENALDAMSGGGTLALRASFECVAEGGEPHPAGLSPGRYVRLDVVDAGGGMEPATLSRLGEPFFTTKPVGRGAGLGAAVAHGFAAQSGGGFAVRSAPGSGTTGTLWLPASEGCHDVRHPDPVWDHGPPTMEGAGP